MFTQYLLPVLINKALTNYFIIVVVVMIVVVVALKVIKGSPLLTVDNMQAEGPGTYSSLF